jgi:hypothetical protein
MKMPYHLPNGEVVMNLTDENKGILNRLIKCCKDADTFVHSFLIYSMNENMAVGDYRVHRIEQRNMSLTEFTNLFLSSQVTAMEELFMKPLRKQENILLTNKIKTGKITPIIIFSKFKEQPRANLLRLLA